MRVSSTCRTVAMLSPLVVLAGCEIVDDIQDAIDGLTNPLVGVGLVALAEAPATDYVDLAELGLDEGLGATLFLADANDVSNLDNAPVTGARVALTGCDTNVLLPEQDMGLYLLTPDAAPEGCGADRDLALAVVDEENVVTASMPVVFPVAFQPDIPTTWTSGTDMVIDLTGAEADAAIAVVIDTSTGAVTYSNEPQTAGEYYQLFSGSGTMNEVVIPGEAFMDQTLQVVVLTLSTRAPNADVEGVNTVLTTVHGGRTTFSSVLVGDLKLPKGQLP